MTKKKLKEIVSRFGYLFSGHEEATMKIKYIYIEDYFNGWKTLCKTKITDEFMADLEKEYNAWLAEEGNAINEGWRMGRRLQSLLYKHEELQAYYKH